MIVLQLDRSRVHSVTLGLSLRSLASVLLCEMDGANKAVAQSDQGDRQKLAPVFFI